ncbi:MAG: rhomboid family intramembrane serine protease [Anaerolineae bacterium]|nr:rhomboid family intramembrane serine protease [Anaerolineae bacterium]
MENNPEPGSPWHSPAAPIVQLQIPQAIPFWTYVLLGLNLLIFAGSWLLGPELILALGAKVNEAIIAGEVWRLATAMFLHVDLLHIAFNSYALFSFGQHVERPYGRFCFLSMYVLSGLAGSAFSFLCSSRPSVGASGAIFGLIGVLGAYLYRYRDRLAAGRSRLSNVIGIVIYNLLYGFVMPAVDNWAHIGGLLAGLVLGWFLAPVYQIRQRGPLGSPQLVNDRSPWQWLVGTALVSVGIAIVLALGFLRWGGSGWTPAGVWR